LTSSHNQKDAEKKDVATETLLIKESKYTIDESKNARKILEKVLENVDSKFFINLRYKK